MIARELRELTVEGLGTAVLSASVIGAGLFAERFPGQLPFGADWLAALIGGAVLAVLMAALAVRVNPLLTLVDVLAHRQEPEPAASRVGVQVAGAILGVMAAHAAFDMGMIQHGGRQLIGAAVWAGEAGATFVFVVAVSVALAIGRLAGALVAGLTLMAACLLTPAMSLANPALLIARTLTDSYLGVRAGDAVLLLACQIAAAVVAGLVAAFVVRLRSRHRVAG